MKVWPTTVRNGQKLKILKINFIYNNMWGPNELREETENSAFRAHDTKRRNQLGKGIDWKATTGEYPDDGQKQKKYG